MKFGTKTAVLGSLIAILTVTLVLGLTTSLAGGIRAMEEPLLGFLKAGNLTEIVLKSNGEERTLKKKGASDWEFVRKGKPFPTAEGKVKRLIDVLAEGRLVEIVTDKEENWKTFGVGDDGNKRLVLSGDQGKAEIVIGSSAKMGTREYVRVRGDKRVFVVSSGIGYYAEQNDAYWSDLRIFPKGLEGRQIVAIAVKGSRAGAEPAEKVDYRLIREKEGEGPLRWVFPGRAAVKVKQSAAEGLANALSQAAGSDFVQDPGKEDTGLDSPGLTVEFTAQDQKTYRLLFGKSSEGKKRFCTGSVDGGPLPYTYLMGESAAERAAPAIKTLIDTENPADSRKKP